MMMRYSLLVVGLVVALAVLGEAAVVQSRYRNVQEILVPVTVIQDGDVVPEFQKISTQVKPVYEVIPEAVDEEKTPLKVAEVAVEAHRRIDDDILEEEIKEVAEAEENKELLKALKEKVEKLEEVKEQELKQEESTQEVEKTATDNFALLSDLVPDVADIIKQKQPVEQKEPQQDKDGANEIAVPQVTGDVKEDEPEGSLRQATQATPSQTTTQQNFVQQLIQNSPLGQFFNQISGQTTQGQVTIVDAAATPTPTIPGFLAPAITAAQTVVNTTTSAFQGLQQFASNLGNQFQNTLSGLGGQQPAQQNVVDGTTARPAGPFQQLVNTFMGNNNQQATPAPQQGPLQGLLNIFQGNNNNNNKPQGNDASATVVQPAPAKQPEVVEQANEATESSASPNTDDELSNEIRTSAESEDSFEEAVQPEEMIVVQDDNSQRKN